MRMSGLYRCLVCGLTVAGLAGCTLKRMDLPCPGVTSLAPAAAHGGDTVSIKGSNFVTGRPQYYKISIGSQSVAVLDVPDANTVRFKVPVGVGDGQVSLSQSESACSGGSTPNFVYLLTPTSGVKVLAAGLVQPAGMDIDANGNLFLADQGGVIRRIKPDGEDTVIAGIGGQGTKDGNNGNNVQFNLPADVAVGADGTIYVADENNECIRKVQNYYPYVVTTAAGAITTTAGSDLDAGLSTSKLNDPTGVAMNGTDSLYVIENTSSRLRFVDFKQNKVTTLIGGGTTSGLSYPARVVFSRKRNPAFPILVADTYNKRILEVSTTGMTNQPITLDFMPQDLAVDDNGNILVLNQQQHKVSVIYKDGSLVDLIGPANYAFSGLAGIAIDTRSKAIYISDAGLKNVVVVNYQ